MNFGVREKSENWDTLIEASRQLPLKSSQGSLHQNHHHDLRNLILDILLANTYIGIQKLAWEMLETEKQEG